MSFITVAPALLTIVNSGFVSSTKERSTAIIPDVGLGFGGDIEFAPPVNISLEILHRGPTLTIDVSPTGLGLINMMESLVKTPGVSVIVDTILSGTATKNFTRANSPLSTF